MCIQFYFKGFCIEYRIFFPHFFNIYFCKNISISYSLKLLLNSQINDHYFNHIKILKNSSILLNLIKFNNTVIFTFTEVEKICLPPKIKYLKTGFFNTLKNLKEISISSQNSNFLYLDNNFLLEKSINSKTFDKLLFVRRDIEYAIVPSSVKQICEYSFAYTTKLKTIEFFENSKLQIIEKEAFHESLLTNISIPSNVEDIASKCFSICPILKTIEFNDNPNLTVINSQMFACSAIERITVPYKVNQIDKMAFNYCWFLKTCECIGDSLLLEEECFNDCKQLFIISFPNASYVKFEKNSLGGVFHGISIFVHANAKFNF